MRWYLAVAIWLWVLFISQGSAANITPNHMCSSITYNFSSDSKNLTLLVKNITSIPRDCSCEITPDRGTSSCSFYTCSRCTPEAECTLDTCQCTKVVKLTISPTCISISINWICPLVDYEAPSCQTSMKFVLGLSTKPSIYCSAGQEASKFVHIFQPIEIEAGDKTSEHAFKEENCTARPVTPNASSTRLTSASSIYSSSTTSARIEYRSDAGSTPKPGTTLVLVPMTMNRPMTTEPQHTGVKLNESERNFRIGVGVGVGVGGGVLLIIAIIIVIFILRRRRAESNKPHANNAFQATPAASSENAYESYNIRVSSAAYDNATNGTPLNYQPIVYDNEEVDYSGHAYTEVNGINDHYDYDNSEMGRSEPYSLCQETGEDYDNISENQSANIENETTVIDNEFYEQ